ncbi:MAG TPA: hypothetical protein VE132_01295, partial [Micromonosporaceae bacterium]|nr:hypothetical protein [Micromonosporaceae bacterium]
MNRRPRSGAAMLATPGESDGHVAADSPGPVAVSAYGVPVASTVYVTGVEPGSGRATVALGVAEL